MSYDKNQMEALEDACQSDNEDENEIMKVPKSGGNGLNDSVVDEEHGEFLADKQLPSLRRTEGSDEAYIMGRALTFSFNEEINPSIRERLRATCWPYGLTLHAIPLVLCLFALTLTSVGSWHCSYFRGATISFTGSNYGLWTLEDISGKCQLWNVLFFSYDLGGHLIAARCFSMATMLFGLSMLTTMSQALKFYAIAYGIGVVFLLLFIMSVSTTSIFNVWIVFWCLTYCIYILIVRALFIHPVLRKISQSGSKILARCFLLCSFCSLLTLSVLKSDFCTCRNITAGKLEERDPGQPCEGTCKLGPAGYVTIAASVFWFLAALSVNWFGVQPQDLKLDTKSMDLVHVYRRESIMTRAALFGTNVSDTFSSPSRSGGSKQRLRKYSTDTSLSTRESESMHTSGIADSPIIGSIQSVSEQECEEDEDTRIRCQKICCDYRASTRTRKERWMFWSIRVMLFLLMFVYAFIIFLLLGSRSESTKAAKAPSTTKYFVMDEVCAYNPNASDQPFVTFPSKEDAHAAGFDVAHCGACAYCSNPVDIETYVETRTTIANSAKECSITSIFGSYDDLVDCLEDKIGFTRECTQCWADNMKTTEKECLSTCTMTLFTGFMSNNNVPGAGDDGWLNPCLFCDEKISGPAFVTCSGVARRRLGIDSEIMRNPGEQCQDVDVDWLNVDWEKEFGITRR